MAKYLLLRSWLVFLKTRAGCGLPIFLKGNHQLESRMQEICQSGSEGGAKLSFIPTPISAQGFNPGKGHLTGRRALKGRKIGLVQGATFIEQCYASVNFKSAAL